MRLKDGLTLRKIGKEFVIVQPDLGMQDMTKVFTLNEVSAYLWEAVQGKDFTAQHWEDLLLERYAVEPEVAKADVEAILVTLREQGLIVD